MMMFARAFLGFNAVAVGLIGLGYLYDPNVLLARYKLEAGSVGMDNMLRSAYGGLFVAMAVILACGALIPGRTSDALLFTILFMGGFSLGRIASIVRLGSPGRAVNGLLYYELTALVLAVVLHSTLRG